MATTQRLVPEFFRPVPIASTVEHTLRLDSARAPTRRNYDTGAFFARGDREERGRSDDPDGEATFSVASDQPFVRRATTRLILLRRRMSRLRWLAAAILLPSLVVATAAFARERVLEARGRASAVTNSPTLATEPRSSGASGSPDRDLRPPPVPEPPLATAAPSPSPAVASKAQRANARPATVKSRSRSRPAPLKLAGIVTPGDGVPNERE